MEQFDIILLLGMRLYDDATADPTTIGRVDKATELSLFHIGITSITS